MQDLTGLISFSFFLIGYLIKAEEHCLPHKERTILYPIRENTVYPIRENNLIHIFLKGIKYNVKCNQPRQGFELVLLCPFPTTITITP